MQLEYLREGYATLSKDQWAALVDAVSGQQIVELGSGNGSLARRLSYEARPASYTAIDKAQAQALAVEHETGPDFIQAYFSQIDARCCSKKTVILSWPDNNCFTDVELLPHLHAAEKIIFIGKMDTGSACGEWRLWTHLSGLRRLDYHPAAQHDAVIFYSNEPRPENQPLIQEEYYGLQQMQFHQEINSFMSPFSP